MFVSLWNILYCPYFLFPSLASCALCGGSSLYFFSLFFLLLVYCSFSLSWLSWAILLLIWLHFLPVLPISLRYYWLVEFSLPQILPILLLLHVQFPPLHLDKIKMNHAAVIAPVVRVGLVRWLLLFSPVLFCCFFFTIMYIFVSHFP